MAEITVEQARALYDGNDSVHAFDHILRVTRLAEHIAEMEGADRRVVRTAGLLHDIARLEPDHHLAGAQRAQDLLEDENPAFVDAVVHCIESHRFSTPPHPETIEAKCLCDADKLDAIGAIGIARVFGYAGHHNNRLWTAPLAELREEVGPNRRAYRAQWGGSSDYSPSHELLCKLECLAEGMHTATARRTAAQRHAFMLDFFARLDEEALGRM